MRAHKDSPELTLVHIELITQEVGPVTCTHFIYDVMWTFTSQPALRGKRRAAIRNSNHWGLENTVMIVSKNKNTPNTFSYDLSRVKKMLVSLYWSV